MAKDTIINNGIIKINNISDKKCIKYIKREINEIISNNLFIINHFQRRKIKLKEIISFRIIIILMLLNGIYSYNSTSYRKLQSSQKIIIKVKEYGEQEIIYSEFANIVKVYIEGEEIIINENNKINVPEGRDTIILQWDNVQTNCEKMFSGLSNIIEIDFSLFDTSEVNRMKSFFENCINLKKINFGENFVTSLIESMFGIFYNCISLTSLDLSHFDTSHVSQMQNLFYNCYSLTSLDLSNFNTSQVNSMENMFFNCTSLSSIIFYNIFNTEKVTNMLKMFYKCESLISLDLSNFFTPLVETMNNMFYNCFSLEYLNIQNFDTSKTTDFSFMFSRCQSLKSLNLRNFNTELVVDMNEMFNGCNSLTFLDVSSFNTKKVQKMNKMFKNCYLLTSLDISRFDVSLVNQLESFFEGCELLSSLDVSNFNTSSCISMANMFDDCQSIKSLNISKFDTNKVTNMKNMFTKCYLLTSLNIANFDTSKVTNLERMFDSCSSLKELDLSNFNTSLVNNMQKMFSNCISLTSLDISKFNTSLVDNFINMFYNCKQLISLDLSSFDTSKITIMEKMFYNCSKISSLDLSKFNTSLVINMISMFDGCSNLEYINMNNFKETISLQYNNMFKDTKNNLIYCIENENLAPNIKYLLNKKECEYLDCNQNWKENYENRIKEKKNDINIIYDKCIIKDIEEIIDDFYFSNEIPGVSIYIYNMDNIEELKNKYTNLTFIEISKDRKIELFKQFGINEKENLYVFVSDSPSINARTATSDYKYVFLLGNGTQLNLSQIKEDLNISLTVPIRNLSLANFDYAIEFSKEGYDIYNKNDNFYNNICSPASMNNNDITLKDRKNDIYPNNVTLCKENCEYKKNILDEQRIVCICNLNTNNKTNETSETNIIIEENQINKVVEYILDNINFKIFKCYYLIISFDNIVKNPAFYIIIIIFIISLFCSVTFFFVGISNIRVLMYKELPTKMKLRELILQHIREMKNIKRNNLNNNTNDKNLDPPKKKIVFETVQNSEYSKEPEKKNSENSHKILLSDNIKLNKKHIINKGRNKKGNYIDYKLTTEEYLNNIKNTKESKDNKKDKEVKDNKEDLVDKENKNNEENKQEKGEKENIIIQKKINFNKVPFTQAVREDKRSGYQVLKSLLFEKIEFLNIFIGKDFYRTLEISKFLLSLLLGLFFNTLFYSDEVVSHKYHNNGKLNFIITIALSIISNIITAIFVHFIENSKIIDEKLELIQEVRNEKRYLFWVNKYIKSLKQKIIIFIIIEIIIILGCFYYIIIFFIIYSKSRKSLLINYLVSLLETLLKSIVISTIITISRKLGIIYKNVYLYNFSKFIDHNF